MHCAQNVIPVFREPDHVARQVEGRVRYVCIPSFPLFSSGSGGWKQSTSKAVGLWPGGRS